MLIPKNYNDNILYSGYDIALIKMNKIEDYQRLEAYIELF